MRIPPPPPDIANGNIYLENPYFIDTYWGGPQKRPQVGLKSDYDCHIIVFPFNLSLSIDLILHSVEFKRLVISVELSIDQALQKAVEAHKAGQIQEADRLYTAILKVHPKHPDANHNLGVLAVSIGKAQDALPFFKTALQVNPSIAQFWISYIDALIKLDRPAEAKAVFDQAKSKGVKDEVLGRLQKKLAEIEKASGADEELAEFREIFNLVDKV